MFECFHCGHISVIWDCDYMFEDFGYIGEGIVHKPHCTHCGAEIEYCVPIGGENATEGSGQAQESCTEARD